MHESDGIWEHVHNCYTRKCTGLGQPRQEKNASCCVSCWGLGQDHKVCPMLNYSQTLF